MRKDRVPVILRVLALVGMVALNTALPAEAFEECYSCFDAGGPAFCLGGSTGGHTFCEPHDGHCDMAGPCVAS